MLKRTCVIHGIRCGVLGNCEYRFSAEDVGRELGISLSEIREYADIKDDVRFGQVGTIDFDGIISLAKYVSMPVRFADDMQDDIWNNKPEPGSDFTNEHKKLVGLQKKIRELKEILGDGPEYKIVQNIPWVKEEFSTKNHRIYSVLGRKLSDLSVQMGVKIGYVKAFGYCDSTIRQTYHFSVINALHQQLRRNYNKMRRWRKTWWPTLMAA